MKVDTDRNGTGDVTVRINGARGIATRIVSLFY